MPEQLKFTPENHAQGGIQTPTADVFNDSRLGRIVKSRFTQTAGSLLITGGTIFGAAKIANAVESDPSESLNRTSMVQTLDCVDKLLEWDDGVLKARADQDQVRTELGVFCDAIGEVGPEQASNQVILADAQAQNEAVNPSAGAESENGSVVDASQGVARVEVAGEDCNPSCLDTIPDTPVRETTPESSVTPEDHETEDTPTPTRTSTPEPSSTPTPSKTKVIPSPTKPEATATNTVTSTATQPATATSTETSIATPPATSTSTETPPEATATDTNTPPPTETSMPTSSPTAIETPEVSPTRTNTPKASATPWKTVTVRGLPGTGFGAEDGTRDNLKLGWIMAAIAVAGLATTLAYKREKVWNSLLKRMNLIDDEDEENQEEISR